jgi:hypothetical protein
LVSVRPGFRAGYPAATNQPTTGPAWSRQVSYDPNQHPYGQPPQGQPPYGQPPQGQPPYGPPHGEHPYGGHPHDQPPPVVSGPPAAPYSGPPAGYYPPQPAPQKRKKWPWIVGGLLALMILGCVGVFAVVGAGTKAAVDSLEEADQNLQGANAADGQMNKPATDGKFQFTVTGMKCGVDRIGPKEFGEQAQGEFCLVDVTIKNVGEDAEVFADSSQKAYDAKGTEFSVDSGAALYANEDSSTFLEQINPGNQVKGKLVFDVPQGTKLTSVVLHESMFTAGIKIPLK